MAGDPCSAAPSVHIRAVPTVSVADTPAGEALERWLFGPVCDTDKHRAGWDSYFFPRHVGAHVAKPTTLLGFQEEALDRLLTATHREQVDPAMQRYAVSNVARFEWVFARVMQKMCVESRLVTAESLDTPGGAGAPWTTGLLTVATPPPLAGRPCVWGPNAGLCHMQACTCEPACAEPLSETDAPRPRARFIAHWIEDTVLLVVFSKTGGIQITLQGVIPHSTPPLKQRVTYHVASVAAAVALLQTLGIPEIFESAVGACAFKHLVFGIVNKEIYGTGLPQ